MVVVEAILGIVLLVVLAYMFGWWVYYTVKFMTVIPYRHLRYTRHGLCWKCHKPVETVEYRPADQTYGPDHTSRLVCSCGAKSIEIGNRRPADWAGF